MRNPKKDGHILFWFVLFRASRRREEVLSPRKAERWAGEGGQWSWSALGHLIQQTSKAATSSAAGRRFILLMPTAPKTCWPSSAVPLQPCTVTHLPGAPQLPLSPGY